MAKKKRKKKQKKTSIFKSLFIFIFVMAIVGVVGFFGFKSYTELNEIKQTIEEYEFSIDEESITDLTLPTQINDKIQIEWTSSNPNVIANDGKVTQPSFEEEGVNVTLTAQLVINYEELLSEYLVSFLIGEIEPYSFTVYVPSKEATDEDKVNLVLDKLTIANQIYDSIKLPHTASFEDINITWSSSNKAILSDAGNITRPDDNTEVTLTATVSLNNVSLDKEFKVLVLKEEPVIEVVDEKFDEQAPTSQYKTIKGVDGVTYYNAKIMQEEGSQVEDETDLNATVPSFIRFRNKDENNGYFEINNISNPKEFSFKYKYADGPTSEKSKLIITVTSTQQQVYEVVVLHTTEYLEYCLDLTAYSVVSIKVEHLEDWSSDVFLDIDDVYVSTNAANTDIENWIINNTPTSVSNSIILPFSTIYGGQLTWESDSTALTNTGIVSRLEEPVTVTLTCKINYLGNESTITIEVLVKGKGSSEALEIYFIDIGKYGAGDCGECTYIKFGDIDVIVDAGDHFEATIQAVTETINQKLSDGVIEYVIATHPDGDHIGGMTALFETYEIQNLIKFEDEYHTNKFTNLKNAYIAEGCNVYEIKDDIIDQNKAEKFIKFSNDIYIDFIDTTYYHNEESNGKSIVFKLTAYGTTVLMTGDADNGSGHTDLEEKYQNTVGDIDILKVVHHGTNRGTTSSFLDTVKPEVAIICNGNYLGNKHGHPTPDTINNLYNYNEAIKVYAITGGGTVDGTANMTNRTYKCSSEDRFNQRNGTITLAIDNNGYTITSEYYNDKPIQLKDTIYYQAIESVGLGR